MNPKRLIPFAMILLVLLVVVALIKSRSPETSLSDEVELQTVIPATVRSATTQKIEIIDQDGESVILVKEREKWQVNTLFDAAADFAKLERLLNNLSGLLGEERSNSATVLGDYQLEEGQAATLNIYMDNRDNPAVSLLVGKSLGYRNSFVRQKGENAVYLVNLDLSRELGLTNDDFDRRQNNWADKRVLIVDRNSVVKVAIKTPDEELNIVKKEESVTPVKTDAQGQPASSPPAEAPVPQVQWLLNGENAPLGEINKVLNSLNNVNATMIIDPARAEKLGLDKPTHHLEVTTKEGEVKSLFAVKGSEGKDYYVKTPATKVLYQVRESLLKQMFKGKKELLGAAK